MEEFFKSTKLNIFRAGKKQTKPKTGMKPSQRMNKQRFLNLKFGKTIFKVGFKQSLFPSKKT